MFDESLLILIKMVLLFRDWNAWTISYLKLWTEHTTPAYLTQMHTQIQLPPSLTAMQWRTTQDNSSRGRGLQAMYCEMLEVWKQRHIVTDWPGLSVAGVRAKQPWAAAVRPSLCLCWRQSPGDLWQSEPFSLSFLNVFLWYQCCSWASGWKRLTPVSLCESVGECQYVALLLIIGSSLNRLNHCATSWGLAKNSITSCEW